jgi:outer membrane protein OmpA-like peptidoglycan-associated protein
MLSTKLRICILTALTLLGITAASPAQETVKVKGFIVARDGAAMNVKGEMASWTIVLTDDTKVQAIKGTFGLRKDTLGLTDLIPGLPVEVETEHMGRELFARSVKFKADDLKTARQIEAGQIEAGQPEAGPNPNSQKQQDKQGDQANSQATTSKKFGELSEYDVKGEVTIYFAVGSTVVPDDAKQQLKELAENAEKQKGFMIQVAGYADSSGNAAYNQELSDRRAETVVDYLQQDCKVPLSRVLSPEGMGESNPAGSNESQQGKKENRRVEVKVLVNRGTQS